MTIGCCDTVSQPVEWVPVGSLALLWPRARVQFRSALPVPPEKIIRPSPTKYSLSLGSRSFAFWVTKTHLSRPKGETQMYLNQPTTGYRPSTPSFTVLAKTLIGLANVEVANVTWLPSRTARPYINIAQFPFYRPSRRSCHAGRDHTNVACDATALRRKQISHRIRDTSNRSAESSPLPKLAD